MLHESAPALAEDQIQDLGSFVERMRGELHEDLSPYVSKGPMGPMIHHPLIVEVLYIPGMAGVTNGIYQRRLEELARAKAESDWGRFVFTHERPYRADALRELLEDELVSLDAESTWRLVSQVWTDSENVQENDDLWDELWGDDRSRLCMTVRERRAFDLLPEEIEVWHGLERQDATLGFSWTTSPKVARWFAARFARQHERDAFLAAGKVKKRDVKAYLLGRNEKEIIAFPGTVFGVSIARISAKTGL